MPNACAPYCRHRKRVAASTSAMRGACFQRRAPPVKEGIKTTHSQLKAIRSASERRMADLC
eukprot:scaffold71061_cov27-Tisochrysis_lutea.AAC.2